MLLHPHAAVDVWKPADDAALVAGTDPHAMAALKQRFGKGFNTRVRFLNNVA
jgi:hypothetical protein